METKWDWLDATASGGKKWVPYEDQYQDIFNLALKNNNPKSFFSVNGVQYETDYQRMMQKNLKTNYVRAIRMRIEDSEDKNRDSEWCYWEWMNDVNKWIMYPPEINLELESHYRSYLKDSTQSSFTIQIGDSVKVNYIVDFKKMAQINSKSYFTRNVRRTIASDITNKSEMKVEPKDEAEEGPSSNLRKRKSGTAASAKSASNLAVKEEEKSENEPVKKLKKTQSQLSDKRKKDDEEEEPTKSSGRGAGRKKVKKEEEEEVEVKEEKKEIEEEEVSKSTKSRGRKKAAKKEEDDEDEDKEADTEVKEENVKVVAFSGEVPVDEKFLEMVDTDYRVYIENGVIYDCMLNQTNLQFNNNKYYLIQLLESKKSKKYAVWMRWGRVGKVGQFSVEHCASDLNRAKAAFEQKFLDKTRNHWSEKDSFEKYPGKYDLVVKEYDSTSNKDFNDELDAAMKKSTSEASKQPVPDSTLDKSVQQLIELICNVREMESMLKELKYDAKKAPLGKLGKSQIKAGYAALKEIEALIKANDFGSKFIQANNDFYTRIPHDFGMRIPPTIRTMKEVREKVKLLELLDDIEVAVKALEQKSDTVNPIDRHYEQLSCEVKPIDRNSDTFKLITDYIAKTHAATHNAYKLKVLDVFEAERKGERERFVDHGNRMLLWHGSRITNWAGILTQGLRIAPEEAPVTGYMFGKGVYFSDCCSKSANYCYTTSAKNVGILSLSEVSLGQMNDLKQADYNANKLPSGKHSTRGVGRSVPNPAEWVTLDDGLVVPCGKLKSAFTNAQESNSCALLYNEYIVYNENQIKLKYIVKVEFVYDDEE